MEADETMIEDMRINTTHQGVIRESETSNKWSYSTLN